ncbi:HAD family hydrolase [Haloferacaceae archaeon DSL9]
MYDAVIFDNDGVLVRRTAYDVLRAATWSAFEAVGIDSPSVDQVEAMVIGVTPSAVETLCGRYGVDADAFWRAREDAAVAAQRDEVRAGRKRPYGDITALDALSAPLGIVSSNQQQTVEFLLDHFGLAGYFDAVYGREPTVDSLRLKKPEPHYLNEALDALDADRALFVGDNDSDVEAAENAGIDSAFIRRPHRRDHDPNPTPTHVVSDLHDVVSLCRGG